MTGFPPPRPEQLVYVIGDIHGCADRLEALFGLIDDDILSAEGETPHVVTVGDYVDRGEHSADVLRFLHDMNGSHPEFLTCLAGNHEQMLLEFMADPAGRGKRWLEHGGLQTLASFGLSAANHGDSAALFDLAGDLRDAIGAPLIGWLENLPIHWQSGNLWVVHAAADPEVALDSQTREALLWGHEAFLATDRSDGQWVAFGHQPFEAAFAGAGRIATDTGAVYGGAMTAARITRDGEIRFLQA